VLELQLWLVVLEPLAVQHVPLDFLQLLYEVLGVLGLHARIM
jgi:hypothetical protein